MLITLFVFKTPIHYLFLMHNADNDAKKKKKGEQVESSLDVPCALVFALRCVPVPVCFLFPWVIKHPWKVTGYA